MGSRLSSLIPSSFAPPPPAPPPSPSQIKYDVFLSFRGEDTRYNFITHLHKALDERGINTFIDYNLNRGDEISPALLTAIEESRISVIIFSKNYASSSWCLEELTKILECKNRETNTKIVIPVFYGVTPSDLRNQTESFADAFALHEKHFKQNLERVHRWKVALKEAANLSGWPSSSHQFEAELIEAIVEDVWQKLDYFSSSDTSKLVGIDSKIKEIESWLCTRANDVRSIGIWGIGGIGKTTLAEAVFNKISHQFKGCSYFVHNVRERCEQSDGLNRLQQELISALLGDKRVNINTSAVGRTFIKNRLSRKKFLIAFDDVSSFREIEGLIGGFDCLGPQSRIIITTRDKHVLENSDVNNVYRLQELNNHEGLELFSMYAFRSKHPIKGYMELSERVVKYAGGIPLALRVLGSYLYKRKLVVWESALRKMRREPNMDIQKVLKISYDGLDNEVKRIFLDIACFFKYSRIENVKSILEACGFHSEVGMTDLLDKSLIVISHGTITMHDLLEVMAKKIVCEESIDPGKRSRLWDHEEIYHILTKYTGTETIEGIALDMSKIRENIVLNPSNFIKMHRLRILKFYDSSRQGMNRVYVSQGLGFNFSALKYLAWHGYCSINSPLSSFSLENLVILDMSGSKLDQLWIGALPLPKLKEVDLRFSHNLTVCPDLSGSPNLKKLDLSYCPRLCEISPSICCLSELEFLDLSFCKSLQAIPDFSEELPLSFESLNRLQSLRLDHCTKLERLPSTFCMLKSLQNLQLYERSKLDQVPEDIGSLSSLKVYYISRETATRELPSAIIYMRILKHIIFSGFILNRSDIDGDSGSDSYSDSMADGRELSEDDRQSLIYHLLYTGNWELSIRDPLSTFSHFDIVYMDSSNWEMAKRLSKLQMGGRWRAAQKVLSSLSFEIRTGLSDFEDTMKNAVYVLQKVLKKVSILLHCPGSEVPKWFDFRSTGYFINLSPNWLNQSFMGFALCIVLAPCHPEEPLPSASPKAFQWTCKLKSKDGQSFIMEGHMGLGTLHSRNNIVFVNFPLLPFCPRTLSDAKEISFEIEMISYGNPLYKIEKCGVHLLYAQYIEETDGSSHVGEEENILSCTNVHHNCEEVDEPHPKRLKTPY